MAQKTADRDILIALDRWLWLGAVVQRGFRHRRQGVGVALREPISVFGRYRGNVVRCVVIPPGVGNKTVSNTGISIPKSRQLTEVGVSTCAANRTGQITLHVTGNILLESLCGGAHVKIT